MWKIIISQIRIIDVFFIHWKFCASLSLVLGKCSGKCVNVKIR